MCKALWQERAGGGGAGEMMNEGTSVAESG